MSSIAMVGHYGNTLVAARQQQVAYRWTAPPMRWLTAYGEEKNADGRQGTDSGGLDLRRAAQSRKRLLVTSTSLW